MLFIIIALLILFVAGFYASVHILQWFVDYLAIRYTVNVATLSPLEAVMNIMQLTLLLVLMVCLPILVFVFISYIRPALYLHERRLLIYVPLSLLLGALGALFGWYLSVEIFIPYFDGFSRLLQLQNMWSLNYLTSFVIMDLFIFFLVFQIPLIVTVLHSLGFLQTKNMVSLRKIVVLLSVVLGAVVTPPDVISQLIVAAPLYVLFELSIQYCRFKDSRQARRSVKKRRARAR
ncbi:twin arginine-targeting protein translocase TatC [Candidatus Termititenax persephonae]|uniref:Sec-independent protein translocase protein TatC n=1 Tax=Candidatus Termititenax persephonae TaxID=2218525 RepID=A0A388TIV0_9BACT|nr:twin arginine-targeting protein translocase TatC [Candidatus Termititenax persephonae]